jgi:hypothetical protein
VSTKDRVPLNPKPFQPRCPKPTARQGPLSPLTAWCPMLAPPPLPPPHPHHDEFKTGVTSSPLPLSSPSFFLLLDHDTSPPSLTHPRPSPSPENRGNRRIWSRQRPRPGLTVSFELRCFPSPISAKDSLPSLLGATRPLLPRHQPSEISAALDIIELPPPPPPPHHLHAIRVSPAAPPIARCHP